MSTKNYIMVCKALVSADLITFRQLFINKFIDLGIWVTLVIVVMGYIMPFFGLRNDFGVFQFGGALAATGLFELYGNAVDLVVDFEGDRAIDYSLTLPMPSWMALVSKAFYYALVYIALALVMIPLGKICLWKQLDLMQINYLKLSLALLFQSVFYACFVIWVASIIPGITKLRSVWARFIFPMWFMGGMQFSWMALYATIPWIAFINLLNPMVYITEAVRGAILGQEGYINFWLCLLIMMIFSVIFLILGLKILKKRLDFV